MPHFMIIFIPYINLLNLSWIKKMSIFEEYGAFKFVLFRFFPFFLWFEQAFLVNLTNSKCCNCAVQGTCKHLTC